jgi:hypothetical protein
VFVKFVALDRARSQLWVDIVLLTPAPGAGREQPSRRERYPGIALPLAKRFPAADDTGTPQIVETEPDVERRR